MATVPGLRACPSRRGTVLTGRLSRGIINLNNEAELVGFYCNNKTVITGIEMFSKSLDRAEAGDNVGVVIRGVKKENVWKGMVMSKPGSIKAHEKVQAQVYVLTKEEGGRSTQFSFNFTPAMLSLTWCEPCQVTLPADKIMVMPGECTTITLTLIQPLALEKFQQFALKDRSKIICTGVITDILPSTDQ